jgi:nucleotide-binding universal stress UspA family protein
VRLWRVASRWPGGPARSCASSPPSSPGDYGKVAGDGPARESSSFDAAGLDVGEATRRSLEEAGAEAAGVDIEADVSVQDPADFLVAASEQVDLLVCGSRGYGPRRSVLLGGVSRRVVAGARYPVMVLTRGVDEGLEALVGEPAHATA